ncbi:CDP-alcohol phosphatidyltransferase family protein [Thermodesulfatator atlanticus]|uniref:CDP-alcohol phosphatidyltransferase family protein n=1 Tax=Thermodesulfatator atlanticus TaxID=501497 RepID=UPI0003B394BC|nr:CDP-alcohol phosphatidyltransferase family protein [Thermodesulfatator atlanticus]
MRITANHLTFLRILLLPVPCLLLYGGPEAKIAALGIGSFLGLTDYLDGKLARRHGTTSLGAFLDPIADKIFIVTLYIFLAHLGYLPLWLVGGIIIREILLSSLRRKVSGALPVSWLGKIKTTIQMFVAALVVAVTTFPAYAFWFLLTSSALLLLGAYFSRLRGLRLVFVLGMAFSLPFLAYLGISHLVLLLGMAALFITWFSGFDYLKAAAPKLSRSAIITILPSLFLPILVLALAPKAGAYWPLIPIIITLLFVREGFLTLYPEKDAEKASWGYLVLTLPGLISGKIVPEVLAFLSVCLFFEGGYLFLRVRKRLFG